MASNILFLPFRRSHTVSLSDAIKQYISTKYDQHPDMFNKDLEIIDQLRKAAVHALEPHVSGIQKLQAYAAQLVYMGGKFPVDLGVNFTWYPALGYNTSRQISQNNIRFELANVLFNLAAMYSQMALSSNRSSADGLKVACNYFCNAAGVLAHLRTVTLPDLRETPPEDMDTMTLESLEHLMLAQAQECFWQKAVKDGMRDAIIAKLAAKVSDYYSEAGDFGIKSDIISSEWLHHITAKHHHFAAAAQFRAACDCLEKRKYGEEVARLRDSLSCVNEALKEQRYINKAVIADLNGLKNRVQEDMKRAEKDNDVIYMLPVPPKPELKILDRATMVASRIPKEVSDPISLMGEHSDLGRPLFAKLVPYSVHVAASIYADRRDRLINQHVIEELEALSTEVHEVLRTLNLPGSLQALEKPLGLPPGLISHAEEIRQLNGISRLRKTVEETKKLRDSDTSIYKEGVDFLRAESAEDERARRKYGTDRWTRQAPEATAAKLYGQIAEIEGYLNSATNSDNVVKTKIQENEHLITLLGATDKDLEQYVPNSRRPVTTPAVEREIGKLRNYLNELNRLDTRRKRKIETVLAKAKQDDINNELLEETARLEREYPMQAIEAVQFEDLFDRRLLKYDVDKGIVTEERQEQEEIFKRLRDANTAFVTARRGDTAGRQREQALQSLENAFYKYKEIISNLDVGRKFYNDLAKIVSRFRDDCRSFQYQRRQEANYLENEISTTMSSLSLEHTNQLHQQRRAESQQPPYSDKAHSEVPLTAPTPTRAPVQVSTPTGGMWKPEMGIKFAGAAESGNAGGGGSGGAGTGTPQDSRWNPASGLKFG